MDQVLSDDVLRDTCTTRPFSPKIFALALATVTLTATPVRLPAQTVDDGSSQQNAQSEAQGVKEEGALPPPLGLCANLPLLDKKYLAGGERVLIGKYLLRVPRPTKFALELVGGGGAGGGTSAGDQTNRGDGGKRGEIIQLPSAQLTRGNYILTVGKGGAAVTGSSYRGPKVDGGHGEATTLGRCGGILPLHAAPGGAGGMGDGIAQRDEGDNHYAGNGEDLSDPITHEPLGRGGAGGGWQSGGAPGSGWGSGGGGQGGTTHIGQFYSGAGANGYARIGRAE